MPRFFFDLRNGFGNLLDQDGVDLPDAEAARNYARGVARELMFRDESRKRHWWFKVRNQDDYELFALPFLDVDDTLQHFSAKSRKLIERMSENRLALAEATFNSRMNLLGARAAVARSQSRPYVAAENGRAVLSGIKRTT
jgi:hypothetical protein